MLFLVANGPMPTTASFAYVTTGTAIKTMLQVKPLIPMKIKRWGISFDASVAATPGQIELIETDVAATVTAYAAADINKIDADAISISDPTSAYFSVGTASSGYTASAEGSITAIRNLDGPQLVAPTNQFIMAFNPGEEPVIQAAKFGRIRVKFAAAINCYCWMLLQA